MFFDRKIVLTIRLYLLYLLTVFSWIYLRVLVLCIDIIYVIWVTAPTVLGFIIYLWLCEDVFGGLLMFKRLFMLGFDWCCVLL